VSRICGAARPSLGIRITVVEPAVAAVDHRVDARCGQTWQMELQARGFVPAIRYMRADAERRDQRLSWARSDRAFFASGACHVLAFRLVHRHPGGRYRVVLIRPHEGLPGSHAYATDGVWALDFNGWTLESILLCESADECRQRWPSWDFDRIEVDVDVDLDQFCRRWGHRLPSDFAFDVVKRADRFIDCLPPEPPVLRQLS
jgi:hypothetical protein